MEFPGLFASAVAAGQRRAGEARPGVARPDTRDVTRAEGECGAAFARVTSVPRAATRRPILAEASRETCLPSVLERDGCMDDWGVRARRRVRSRIGCRVGARF